MSNSIVYTIGHSTKTVEQFINVLKAYDIQEVIDIRTIPRSRHNPQFNMDILSHVLRSSHIGYRHMKSLGGLRHAHKGSINLGWHNASFRGFADYMQTDEFKNSLKTVIKIAQEKITVIMCAEALPWHCHRSLVADALLVAKMEVIDIYSETISKPHLLTEWAYVEKDSITYPLPIT